MVSDTSLPVDTTALLAGGLTADEAHQLALVGNREIQARLAELGVARIDILRAGRPANPMLEGNYLLSHDGEDGRFEAAIMQDVLSIIEGPARRRIRELELGISEAQAARALLDVLYDVTAAYREVQAARARLVLHAENTEATSAAAELARRQFAAGATKELEHVLRAAAHEEALIARADAEAEYDRARIRLNLLIGLGPDAKWNPVEDLAAIPDTEPALSELEGRARQRFDLVILEREEAVVANELRLAASRLVPGLDLGVKTTREDGEFFTGPAVRVELPVFVSKKLEIQHLEAESERLRTLSQARADEILSEVRGAWRGLEAAREAALAHRDRIVPLRMKAVHLGQEEYNFMLIGVYQLLETKQDEIRARENSVKAQRDYWLARVALERAVGAPVAAR